MQSAEEADKKTWISNEKFLELTNFTMWKKYTGEYVRKHGLNSDKSINTINFVNFQKMGGEPVVEMFCILNEMQENKDYISIIFDIETKKLNRYSVMNYYKEASYLESLE